MQHKKINLTRILFIFLFCWPAGLWAQSNPVYVYLTDARGQLIRGESVVCGYENWIQALTLAQGGKYNSQISFTMNVSGSAGLLKQSMNQRERLSTGRIVVMEIDRASGQLRPKYTINMEQIVVLGCAESMGCNSAMTTTVSLQATRVGWTYYQTGRNGMTVVSSKSGWDLSTNSAWNNF